VIVATKTSTGRLYRVITLLAAVVVLTLPVVVVGETNLSNSGGGQEMSECPGHSMLRAITSIFIPLICYEHIRF